MELIIKEKLEPEFKAKWITALRSGEYKQGISALYTKSNNTYCCLGVAGAICGISTDNLLVYYLNGMYFDNVPNLIKGIPSKNKIVKFLSFKNDGEEDNYYNPLMEKWSFNQIADWIETNL